MCIYMYIHVCACASLHIIALLKIERTLIKGYYNLNQDIGIGLVPPSLTFPLGWVPLSV